MTTSRSDLADPGEYSPGSSLANLDTATRLLAEAVAVDDVKLIRDQAEAMRALAKQRGLGIDAQNHAAEIKIRAERRLGEILAEMPKNKGVRLGGDTMSPPGDEPTLAELDIEKKQSSRWQQMADIPVADFEQSIIDGRRDGELTTAGVVRQAKLLHPRPVPETNGEVSETDVLPLVRFIVGATSAEVIASIVRTLFPTVQTVLDTTYGLGQFHDGTLGLPVTCHDALAERAPDGAMSVTDLQYGNATFDVVLFDPPHLADGGEDSIMAERFGTLSQEEIDNLIIDGTRECWRVCRVAIIVKVTDHVHAQVFQEESALVGEALNWTTPYEKVHQVRDQPLTDPRWTEHARYSAFNNGSTYLVFKKGSQVHGHPTRGT